MILLVYNRFANVFILHVDGEPVAQSAFRSLANMHLLTGGLSQAANTHYCPLLLQEKGWTFENKYLPMKQRSIDVLYRISNCVPEREQLASQLRSYVESAGFSFVSTGKCLAGKHESERTYRSDGDDWGICNECKHAKLIVSFENSSPGTYLSEKPFLAIEHGAIPLYNGNGQELMRESGVNMGRVVDTSDFDNYDQFCKYVVELLRSPEKLQLLADQECGNIDFDVFWSKINNDAATIPKLQELRTITDRKIKVFTGITSPPFIDQWLPRMLNIEREQLSFDSWGPYDLATVGCCW